MHQGVTYAKLKDKMENHYIFIIPHDCDEVENEILVKGVLIAQKKGNGYYLDKDNQPCRDWKLFNSILPFYPKDQLWFKKQIEIHLKNMGDIQSIKMNILNGIPIKREAH